MFSKKIFLSFFILFFLFSAACAVEIPLSGSVKRGKTGNGIVFVDMEKVFNAHPMSERLKNEMRSFAQTRKQAIEEMIKEHDGAMERIKLINIKITEAHEAGDTAALAELALRMDEEQKFIQQQKDKISDLSKRTKTELAMMEEKNSLAVLKEIDAVLKEISERTEAGIILDKQSVLCASGLCRDITDEVIKRLEGR